MEEVKKVLRDVEKKRRKEYTEIAKKLWWAYDRAYIAGKTYDNFPDWLDKKLTR